MARKTGTSSSPDPKDATAEKPARRGKAPPAPAAETGQAAAEPTTAGGKSPSARKAPARKAPGAGVAAADTPAVGETGAAASEPTTAGGKGRRAAPGTGVAETASAPARKTLAKAGGSAAAKGGRSSAVKSGGPAAATADADGSAAKKSASSPAKGRGGKRETFEETATRRKDERARDQLAEDLRAFAGARPSGWNHDDWVGFLTELAAKGHDCSDPEQVGARLERERLAMSLEAIQGVEHAGVEALANRFQTLWSARHASPQDIAQTAGIPQPQAERVLHALREL
ncbi:hypothetical protein [Longimicrobium terrae]|uniref:Helix-hairpin-helix domain-containing protein n=1 Tax=Longimicrobium terrae TaxID=1639882 RepID=A0A841GYW9_9BACT|nr:hypothetical protein [Longimicrobium terrae]MBB4636550.1 hypothetical protein [Longimicrobium terrae]MBB6070926.1 hypothetical protein [Longimicrobium terrae]NNC28948.1 hypothetical protein [Longimicrobium terrae]